MGAFLAAVLVAVGIAMGASIVLDKYQSTADRAYVGAGARPDPEPKLTGQPPKPKT